MNPSASNRRTARPGWIRPVVQFVAVGLVTAALLAVLTSWFSQRAAKAEAIRDALSTTELLASTVVQPALTAELLDAEAAQVDKFDRLMTSRVLSGDPIRIKIWDAQGIVIYSDEPRIIGDQFELGADEVAVLNGGSALAGISDLSKPENEYEPALGPVLEVYTRVEGRRGEPLLFEVYYAYEDFAQETDKVLGAFRPITVGGILLFLLLTVPLVWLLARRLDDAASDREKLLLAAAQASDGERRRIARDLHDGVVQDLAGTSFALSATTRELATDSQLDRQSLHDDLDSLAAGVRRNLRALRSLIVEIYPPDLSSASLPAALDDLLAPVVASGVDVTIEVPDTSDLPEDVVALVWRTAQECVRNALRHGEPQHLVVRLSTNGSPDRAVRLEVADNGRGFDQSRPVEGDRFGLRGLRDLATEAGGTLVVTTAPGEGTTVVLEVPT